jgi:hypothetical protein
MGNGVTCSDVDALESRSSRNVPEVRSCLVSAGRARKTSATSEVASVDTGAPEGPMVTCGRRARRGSGRLKAENQLVSARHRRTGLRCRDAETGGAGEIRHAGLPPAGRSGLS